jgi:hypothetical protein
MSFALLAMSFALLAMSFALLAMSFALLAMSFALRRKVRVIIKSWNTILFFGLFLKFLVFFTKSFNTPGRIHQFLFAGKKRMALGANFNTDVLAGRADFHDIATGAFDVGFRILRMNIRFHFFQPPIKHSLIQETFYYPWFHSFFQVKIPTHPPD